MRGEQAAYNAVLVDHGYANLPAIPTVSRPLALKGARLISLQVSNGG